MAGVTPVKVVHLAGPPVEFLVMEYLEGQTLTARLAEGKLPLAQALDGRCSAGRVDPVSLHRFLARTAAQSSHLRPATRSNSRTLDVTSVAPSRRA